MTYFVLLDDAQTDRATLYRRHIRSDFLFSDGLDSLDALLQQGWRQGWHSVLFADYEFGLPLNRLPSEKRGVLALHWFAEKTPLPAASQWLDEQVSAEQAAASGIGRPAASIDKARYLSDIAAIHEAIHRGYTYQINHTLRLHLHAYGEPLALYRRLRQPVPYAAFSCLPAAPAMPSENPASQADGAAEHDKRNTNLVPNALPEPADTEPVWTLCFSPELFLNIASDGIITTEPMKGTAPVLNDGQDEARAAALQADPKNRAENVMIVDLLRNDLGKISETGGVRVPEPFKVSRFGNVWQMTTQIEAQARRGTTVADIFRAAFPCGSITGAPKRMSMSIINRLETEARGLYTGSIGFLEPCDGGLGFCGTLNVVIRTLVLQADGAERYRGVYGVGSGIVIDSEAEAEFAECGWKARFLSGLTPDFGVFETMKAENGVIALLAQHEGRLKNAAAALNLPDTGDFAEQMRAYAAALPQGAFRIKAQLDSDGLTVSHAPLDGTPAPFVLISPHTLPESGFLRRFKTTRRAVYDQVWREAEAAGAFDGLIFSDSGVLLEGGRSNVFVKTGGVWHTPSADLAILNGVMRQEILARPQAYLGASEVRESRISREMLDAAEEIRLSNALRGLFAVTLKTDAV